MTVAQVVCVYPPYKSGLAHAAQAFARETAALGHRSVVITPDYRLPGQAAEDVRPLEVRRLRPWLRYGNGAFVPGLVRALRGIDVVYLHYPFYGGQEPLWLAQALGLAGAKTIIHYHMDTPGLKATARFLSLPSRLTSADLFRRARLVTAASLDYVENSNLRGFYGAHKAKFAELPFGVDTGRFKPVQRTLPPGNILFVGALDRAHGFKGLPVLMRAMARLHGQSLRLRIVGHGELKPHYEQMAKDLGIQRETLFLGKLPLSGLVGEYQNAGVLVLPSTGRNEAFGIVLIEALACGTPVIASDLPGVRQVFKPGINGYAVPANDEAALAAAISEIFNSHAHWSLMSGAARDLAVERYSLEAFRKGLDSVYRALAG